MESLKVLVTGGFGFIGSHLIKALLDRGDNATILEMEKSTNSNRSPRGLNAITIDIRSSQDVANYLRENPHDAIVHLAAVTGVARCTEKPSETFDVNVYGTYNIAMAAKESGARLIFASSREVYGNTQGQLSREIDPLIPNNVYGLSKMLGENTIKWAEGRFGLESTVLRFTNVYGPGGDKYNAQAMIRKALSEGVIEVYGGSQVLNLLHVDDAKSAIIRCLHDDRSVGEIFNVCGPDDISVIELCERIKTILNRFGKEILLMKRPLRPTDTEFNRPSGDRIRNLLDWEPRIGLDEGLELTVRYYLERNESIEYARP